MSKNQTAAVVYGAGTAGIRAQLRLKNQYHILAFVDQDTEKHKQLVSGLTVWSPIFLKEYYKTKEKVKVLIASEFSEQIERSLISHVHSEDLVRVSSSDMSKLHFGMTRSKQDRSIFILKSITGCLTRFGIKHHIDAGTLLGLYRDDALIPWDDDLDIALDAETLSYFLTNQAHINNELNKSTKMTWKFEVLFSDKDYMSVKRGDIRSIKLTNTHSDLPSVDLFIKYRHQQFKDYLLASRAIRMPAEFSDTLISYKASGFDWMIPFKTPEYLRYHYGDWEEPKPGWNLRELKNAEVFL